MEKYALFILAALSCVLAQPPRISKHYRTDYKYNRKTDSFYKFHTESRREWNTNLVCEIEGAKLMKIDSQEDLVQAHAMFKEYPDLPFYAWVAQDGQVHDPAEQNPLIYLSEEISEGDTTSPCNVVDRTGSIDSYLCFQLLPFFCKVKATDAPYDSRCGVYGTNYEYVQSTGSCYKIPGAAYSWNEAYAECRTEGSHLLVLNSLAESQVVQNLTRHNRVMGSRFPWFYFAGFRAEPPSGNETLVFKTIFNQTLEEAGFNSWSPNEPNNVGGAELCGSFFRNDGKLNDVNCIHEYGFICEKEIQSTS